MEINLDNELTLRAKGLYSIIQRLSKESDNISYRDIKLYCKEGDSATRAALHELIEKDKISVVNVRNANKFVGVYYKLVR